MPIDIAELPINVQQSIIQATVPVEIVNRGAVVATITPKNQQSTIVANNGYDYFASFDYPEGIADIDFELPERSQFNRQIVDFD